MRLLINALLVLTISVSDIYLFRVGVIPLEPSLSTIPLLFFLVFSNFKYITNYRLLSSHVIFFFFALTILSFLYSVVSTSSEIAYTISLYIMNSILLAACILYFETCSKKQIYNILMASLIVLGMSITSDIFFSRELINRGAGFAENPNSAALRLNFILVGLLFVVQKPITRYLIFGITIVLIFLTLSRSGILIFIAILFMAQITNYTNEINLTLMRKRLVRTFLIFLGVLLLFVEILNYLSVNVSAFQNRGALSRIEQLQGKNGIVADRDLGEDGRLSIAMDYFNYFLVQPFGYGTGMNINRDFYPHSTHNTFLRIMIDFGAIGLFLLLYFIIAGVRKGIRSSSIYYLMFFIAFAIACMFTNTLLENRTFIITLSIVEILRRRNYVEKNMAFI